MKIHRAYFNIFTNRWLGNPYLLVAPGELATFQFQAVTVDRPALSSAGKATGSQAYDLSGYDYSGVFWYKTPASLFSGGDFEQAYAGFQEDAWMDSGLADGAGSIPFRIPTTQTNGIYRFGATCFADATNFMNLTGESIPGSIAALFTGAESTLPEGVMSPNSDVEEISGSDTSIEVSLAGMTSTGRVIVWLEASTAGTCVPWATYGTDAFTLHVPVAPELNPGDGLVWNVGWSLLRLSTP